MERLRARDLRAILSTIAALAPVRSLAEFPAAALAAVERLVPCDHSGYNEIDVERRRARGVVSLPEVMFPGVERLFAEHAHENPLLAHMQRTGEMAPVKFSDFISQRQLHQLPIYHLVYRRLETEHQVALELTASPVVGIVANRSRLDFSERDRAVLEALRPHLHRAYVTAAVVARLGMAVDAGGRGAVVVSYDGVVQAMTAGASRRLAAFFPAAGRSGEALPDDVTSWLRRRQAFRAAEDDLPPPLDPLVVQREGARLRISYVPGAGVAEPDLLLLEEQQEDPARRYGLSAREAEVLEQMGLGLTDAEAAEALGISARTVQAHLQRIYRKLGVSNRTAAVARMQGKAPPQI